MGIIKCHKVIFWINFLLRRNIKWNYIFAPLFQAKILENKGFGTNIFPSYCNVGLWNRGGGVGGEEKGRNNLLGKAQHGQGRLPGCKVLKSQLISRMCNSLHPSICHLPVICLASARLPCSVSSYLSWSTHLSTFPVWPCICRYQLLSSFNYQLPNCPLSACLLIYQSPVYVLICLHA